ncbi:MAG: lipopolysaccharide biosynthesis protein [Streptococcaceae bacterium]|jgi:PST family polysaccharide transporter|nr:lipopolysaccharide biosynthesis protein [Streptococcaceae bacterium]MCH4176005.1 lipopolysaccharide biosynthesis protein [Streptococcaceae bacterium]
MKNEFKTGMIFSAIGQYSYLIVQFIINVVLSRILSPADFGVVAIVQVFLTFFQMFATAGMGPAIIQNKDLDEDDYGILFNYSAILAIILVLFFGILGFFVSKIYHNPIYVPLFWMMSVVILAEGMNVVPNALLLKAKKFKSINIRTVIANMLGAILGVVAAFLGAGVYALILSVAVPALITLILNFFIVKIKFTTSFNTKPLSAVWYFAKNQLGFSLIIYFARNTDNMLIGKVMGASAVGFYSKAYGLTVMPNLLFLGVINPVLQPILAEHQDDVKLIRETYLNIVKILAMIGIPFSLFMVINSDRIIYFLFGNQWSNAILPLSILSLSITAQMISATSSGIFQARNQPHKMFRAGMISSIGIIFASIIGVLTHSLVIVSAFVCLGYIMDCIITNYILLTSTLEDKITSLFRVLLQPIILGVVISVILMLTRSIINLESDFLTLLIRGIIWLIAVLAYLSITGELKFIKSFVKKT